MLHERIRSLRTERGLNQVQLATALGVTKQSISNWENDNIMPSIDMLIRIARFFSVSTDYLLGLDGRVYVEFTGLDNLKRAHVQQIITDIIG